MNFDLIRKRGISTVDAVTVKKMDIDPIKEFKPGHPMADKDGFIYRAPVNIEEEYYYNESQYENDEDPNISHSNFTSLLINNHMRFFQNKIISDGFKKAFKGDWGSASHTKKIGAIQPLNRLSYNSFLSHLRKINLNISESANIVEPHLLHGSQWGIIDPIDTPDGGNVGFHKHLALMTKITHEIDD